MQVGISNLAWTPAEDSAMLADLAALGCQCLEVAPTKLWSDPMRAERSALTAYRQHAADHGIHIVAMQSLLFQQPQLQVFASPVVKQETIDYLTRMFDLAEALGAGPLVFGSPGNRRKGTLDDSAALDVAADFFRRAGHRAAERNVCLCIEPLPPTLGCDFINNVAQGYELVRRVGSAGFGLHLDASSMHTNGEDPQVTIAAALPLVRHYHISEVGYGPFGSSGVDHAAFAAALVAAGYDGVTSLEILGNPAGGNQQLVNDAIRGAKSYYETSTTDANSLSHK